MAWHLIAKNGNFKVFYWFRRITTMTLVVVPQEESRLLDLRMKQNNWRVLFDNALGRNEVMCCDGELICFCEIKLYIVLCVFGAVIKLTLRLL